MHTSGNQHDDYCDQMESLDNSEQQEARGRNVAIIAMTLGDVAMKFASVERVPRYTPERRENNAEHSFMLGLIATELATTYLPDLDSGDVTQFALVHDLVELVTGDIPTYDLSPEGLQNKACAEHKALETLSKVLPPATYALVVRYETQIEPEARFVRLVDKLMPIIVDLLGPGEQIMREDYGVVSKLVLDMNESRADNRFMAMFPEPELNTVHAARRLLAEQFSVQIFGE